MSVELHVYLRRSSMPSPAEWQSAIRAAGFPVDINHDFDVEKQSGFLPCKYAGEPSGFEYFAGPFGASDAVASGAPAGSDFLVTFRTHSGLRELAVSLAAASALCQVSEGLLVDPQSGETYAANTAIDWAAVQLKEIQEQLEF